MKCVYCGEQIKDGSMYCTFCGKEQKGGNPGEKGKSFVVPCMVLLILTALMGVFPWIKVSIPLVGNKGFHLIDIMSMTETISEFVDGSELKVLLAITGIDLLLWIAGIVALVMSAVSVWGKKDNASGKGSAIASGVLLMISALFAVVFVFFVKTAEDVGGFLNASLTLWVMLILGVVSLICIGSKWKTEVKEKSNVEEKTESEPNFTPLPNAGPLKEDVGCVCGVIGCHESKNLQKGESILVGRGSAAQLCITGNESVSRTHCRITYLGNGRYVVCDQSKHGTYLVSGERLPKGEEVSAVKGIQLRVGLDMNGNSRVVELG